MAATDWSDEFTTYACRKLEQGLRQIVRCAALLTDDELWWRPNENSNSIANLIVHLTGNVTQWVSHSIGGDVFTRDRPAEFAARGPQGAAEIVPPLELAVARAVSVISRLNPLALAARYSIQGYDVSALISIFHVVEHFSYHAGQIIYATKAMKDVNLSIYDEKGRKTSADKAYP